MRTDRWGGVIDKLGVVNTFECMVPCWSGGAMVASTLQIRRYKDAWERADYGEIDRMVGVLRYGVVDTAGLAVVGWRRLRRKCGISGG